MMIPRRTSVMIRTLVKRTTVVMTSVVTRAQARTGLTLRPRLPRMTGTEMTMTTEAGGGREVLPAAVAAVEIAIDSPTNLQRRVSTGPRRRKVDMETETGTEVTGR